MMSLRRLALFALVALLVVVVSKVSADDFFTTPDFQSCESNSNLPVITYVSFPQRFQDGSTGLTVAARMKLPKVNGTLLTNVPAVVIVHGSGGLDSRGELYSYELNQQGFATLEVDLWATRGWYLGGRRPRSVGETVPDAFGALYFLSQNVSAIDPTRIGIMGFSWGGLVSMLSASVDAGNAHPASGYQYKFAAHNPHYPVCFAYNHVPGYVFKQTTGANIFIQTGDLDDYDTPTSCSSLIASLDASVQATISLAVYANSTHGFDRLEPAIQVTDPFAHQGRGGLVQFTPNFKTTPKSVSDTLKFFRKQLQH